MFVLASIIELKLEVMNNNPRGNDLKLIKNGYKEYEVHKKK
jgi:hypothetical protein